MLKILAIFLIIAFHMTQTLTAYTDTAADYVINLKEFSLDSPGQSFFLYLFRQFGALGNSIFFICSAWFLVDSRKRYGKKIAKLLMEVWTVSVVILIVVLLTGTVDIGRVTILRCVLPSTFCNNWYITYYCLFLAIVPFLNLILEKLSQKQHLILILFIIVLRIAVEPFTTEWAYTVPSLSIDKWILVYFVIAYMKMYLPNISSSTKMNALLLLLGTGVYLLCVAMNTYGFKSNALVTILINGWQVRQFYLYAMAIALFNLFRKINFHNKLIIRISGYSLLIYILHENLLIREYYRPMVLTHIYEKFGYDYIVGWVLLLALVTFVCALILSMFFDLTIGRMTKQVIEKYYSKFSMVSSSILDRVIRIQ